MDNKTPFRCQKVLPLVYDESLSYYEVLCKMSKTVDTLSETVEKLDSAYEEIISFYEHIQEDISEAIDAKFAEVDAKVNSLETQFDTLKDSINTSLNFMDNKIDSLRDDVRADIASVNARTDLAIEQNNEYIFSHLEESLARITVMNYFTGTRYTVQDMFDYLCQLHVENGITYDELANRNITYDELAALNMTYTQLAMNGGSIIPQTP